MWALPDAGPFLDVVLDTLRRFQIEEEIGMERWEAGNGRVAPSPSVDKIADAPSIRGAGSAPDGRGKQ